MKRKMKKKREIFTFYTNDLLSFRFSNFHISILIYSLFLSLFFLSGNGLIDETEFLQWIGRIQALRETSTPAEDDDLTQDLVAAFR